MEYREAIASPAKGRDDFIRPFLKQSRIDTIAMK